MCKQCPTVGEFICGILRCTRCHNTCERECKHYENKCDYKYENKCENKCDRAEKCYECVCQEKKEPTPCYKADKDCGCKDCNCKFF